MKSVSIANESIDLELLNDPVHDKTCDNSYKLFLKVSFKTLAATLPTKWIDVGQEKGGKLILPFSKK